MSERHPETPQVLPSHEYGTYSDPGHGVTGQTGPRLSAYSGYQWIGENDFQGLNFRSFQDAGPLRVQPSWRTQQRHVEASGAELARSRKTTLSASNPDDASGGNNSSCTTTPSRAFTESESGTDATTCSAYPTISDSCEASTVQLIPGKTCQDARPVEAGRGHLPWSSCALAIGILALTVILLMSVVSTMAGTNRLLLSFPINRVGELPPMEELPGDPGLRGNMSTTKTKESNERRWSKFFAGARRHKTAGTRVFENFEANATTVAAANDWTKKTWVRSKPTRTVIGSHNRAHPTDNFVNIYAESGTKDSMSFPFSHPERPICGAVFYTYCSHSPRSQFHFQRAANACVEAQADALHLCNRGTNRFASMRHCRQSCISAKRPEGACFDEPLFTSCARQDVLSSWWHLRRKKCVPWSFPSGGCPASGSDVFRTAQECEEHCRGPRRRPCRNPDVVSCTTSHLKWPFFAHAPAEGGRLHCLRSSVEALLGHRCLTGANRFLSLEACLVSCRNRPQL